MRVALLYLGCRVNQAETGRMEAELRSAGHETVGLEDSPEVCIVNTCTVTKKSDEQSRQLIRKAARTGARVLATGCYVEMSPDEARAIEGVERVFHNCDKHLIISQIGNSSSSIASSRAQVIPSRSKYFLKAQDGCDNSCTYCIVWKARGRSRSIGMDELVSMAIQAESEGYNEINLTGIHLGMYGRDLDEPGASVGMLLEKLLENTSRCRFRLSSLEVSEVDSRIIELLGDERVCSHLHIPLQSGDAEVLRDMGRGYSPSDFRDKVNIIIKTAGYIGLGTDIIAGFPTENEAAFDNTLSLVRDLPFTYMHVFPYSRRSGTLAAGLDDLPGDSVRKDRAAILRALGLQKRADYMKTQIGKALDVLLEARRHDNAWVGTSENYLKVIVNTGDSVNEMAPSNKGDLVKSRITALSNTMLAGDAIEVS